MASPFLRVDLNDLDLNRALFRRLVDYVYDDPKNPLVPGTFTGLDGAAALGAADELEAVVDFDAECRMGVAVLDELLIEHMRQTESIAQRLEKSHEMYSATEEALAQSILAIAHDGVRLPELLA